MTTRRAESLLPILAALFVLIGAVVLHLTEPMEALELWHLVALVAVWSSVWGGSYALLRARLPESDLLILPPVALMTGWGLLLLARVAPNFLPRQLFWLVIGSVALCTIALLPRLSRWLRRYRYTFLFGGLALLAATLAFGVNPSGYGARLWLGLFDFYFQPSEILKVLLVVYLAAYLTDRRELPREGGLRLWPAVLGPMLLMVGLALILLAWQDDMGAALLYYLTFLALIYLAWGRWQHVLAGISLFVPIAVAGGLLSSRVALRVGIWLDPWAPEQADRAFQILQSLFAQAAGGLLGQGPGLGRPYLIPAVHTDFVYASLVEEYGTVGALGLLALMAFFVQRGLRLASRSKSPFEALLGGGLAALLAIQTWVIVGGNTKLIPITGVTLPFLSYGGSSLVTSMLIVGLLLNLTAPHPLPLALSLPTKRNLPPLRQMVIHLSTALILLFASAAAATGTWTVVRAEALRAYPTNAQRILEELQIRRGRIVDRRGQVLADIRVDADGFVERIYPVPEAAPVLGYATLDYGTAGIEDACEAALRGEVDRSPWQAVVDGLLHRPAEGRTVRLTLDARLQQEAQALLAHRQGAAVLVDARTGEILALASAPTYDPARVGETWEALRDDPGSPLLNRATQALAQPGASLETVVLSTLLEAENVPAPPLPLEESVSVDGMSLTCRQAPGEESWSAALRAACPAPFAEAATTYLETGELGQAFSRWGLTRAPRVGIPTVSSDWNDLEMDPALESIGQGSLLVTPLQMAGVAAALGNGGVRPPLHLIADEQRGCVATTQGAGRPVVEPAIATTLRQMWAPYGSAIGHLSTALAGPERELTWFLGLNSATVPRYAVVVMLENPVTSADAASIGSRLLQRAVAP
ncbi:MAG: FtsW/RodA/SpoVE family cell cycle protein [Anaerolineales bacterium]